MIDARMLIYDDYSLSLHFFSDAHDDISQMQTTIEWTWNEPQEHQVQN